MTIQKSTPKLGTAPLPGTAPLKPAAAPTAGKPGAKAIPTADINAARADVAMAGDTLGALPTFDTGLLTRQAVSTLVKGATLVGNWTQEQVKSLLDALEKVPGALLAKLEGTQFALNNGEALPGDALAYTRNTPKSVTFTPESLKLPGNPATPGVSGFQELALHEVAHLVDNDPLHTQEFAKLSGWKETVYNADGTVKAPACDANCIDRTGGWAEGDQAYGDGSTMKYSYSPNAKFVGTDEARVDPRDDYAESFRSFVNHPEELLATAPEKFLFLNGESKTYSAAQVQQMAGKAGVNLEQVMTNLLVEDRVYQPTFDRIATQNGISADKVKLMAKDQEVIKRTTTMDGLIDRMVSAVMNDPEATPEQLKKAVELSKEFHGMPAGYASGEKRNAFIRLPLEAQLKADPQLALGNSWHDFPADQQALLKDPKFVDQLMGAAREKVGVEHLPAIAPELQAKDQAFDRILDKMFDPSREGYLFRAQLGGFGAWEGKADPKGALEAAGLWEGLPEDQKAFMQDPANLSKIAHMAHDPELIDAMFSIKEGSLGLDRIKTTLNMMRAGTSQDTPDITTAFGQYVNALKASRAEMEKGAGGNMLETALTEINRQVQAGNRTFIDKFLSVPREGATANEKKFHMSNTMGAWIWDKLSPSEQQLLNDPGYRKYLVDHASQNRSTGASLAKEAEMYRFQTDTLQQSFKSLLAPDREGYLFRNDLKKDPVAAMQKRGLWEHLPPSVQRQFQANPAQVGKLVEAVQVAITPIVLKQAGYEKAAENLTQYAANVNASNYEELFNTLELSTDAMQSKVKDGLDYAKAHGHGDAGGGHGG